MLNASQFQTHKESNMRVLLHICHNWGQCRQTFILHKKIRFISPSVLLLSADSFPTYWRWSIFCCFFSFTDENWIGWDSIIFYIRLTYYVHERFRNPWVISRQRGFVFIRIEQLSQYFGKEKEMWEEWHTQSSIDMAYYI